MNFIIMIVTPTQYIRDAAHMVKTKYTPVRMSTARTHYDMSTELNHSHLLHIPVVCRTFHSKSNYLRGNWMLSWQLKFFTVAQVIYPRIHLLFYSWYMLSTNRWISTGFTLFSHRKLITARFSAIAEWSVPTSDLVAPCQSTVRWDDARGYLPIFLWSFL